MVRHPLVLGAAPVAVVVLVLEQDLGAPAVPVLAADRFQVVEDADAFDGPEEVHVLHGELAVEVGGRTADVAAEGGETAGDGFLDLVLVAGAGTGGDGAGADGEAEQA